MDEEQLSMLRKAFMMFADDTGKIESHQIKEILSTIGTPFDAQELSLLIKEKDPTGKGQINLDMFVQIASHFMEEEDEEAVERELKDAFRLYDKEGNGYITTAVLREILRALDDKLTSEDLDGIINEVNPSGSGTLGFQEFMEMMTG